MQAVGSAPGWALEKEEVGLLPGKLLLVPFPRDMHVLEFALEDSGSLGKFGCL